MRKQRYDVRSLKWKKIWSSARIFMFKNAMNAMKDKPKKSGSRIEVQKEVEQEYTG